MSDASDQIEASITVGDFVNVDAANKVNVIGGGIRVIGLNSESGLSAPIGLFVQLASPLPTEGDGPAVELVLTTATGAIVKIGQGPQSQAVRIAQTVEFGYASPASVVIPRGALPASAQIVLNFPTGLPLRAGYSYQWRLQIDHEVKATYSFFVAGNQPPPVFG